MALETVIVPTPNSLATSLKVTRCIFFIVGIVFTAATFFTAGIAFVVDLFLESVRFFIVILSKSKFFLVVAS